VLELNGCRIEAYPSIALDVQLSHVEW